MEYRELGRTGWKVSPSASAPGRWAANGDRRRQRVARDPQPRARSRRQLLRHRRRLRQRAAVGPAAPRAKRAVLHRHQAGRAAQPRPEAYTRENMTAAVEGSLRDLGVETIDLLQLHVPPIEVYNAETFGILDDLAAGQDPPLRRQRRADRPSPEGHRVPQRAVNPDHLQHLPTATRRGVLPRGQARGWESSRACRWPRECSPAR